MVDILRERDGGRMVRKLAFCSLALAAVIAINATSASAQSAATAQEPESSVQLVQPNGPDNGKPPITITLKDALERAQKNDPQFLAALSDAKGAHEDRLQARNAMLPTVTEMTECLCSQGNGVTAEGRFVTNDGVHVYREWAIIHEDLGPNTYLRTGLHRADAAEAIANAKAEIARRGLTVTVTKLYYGLSSAQRKYATAQQALDQSKRFFQTTQDAERLGQVAHADVVKAEIQYRQQEQAFDEARLAMENARLDLAVLLFPTLNENFTVVDDLETGPALPPFPEVQNMAAKGNPDLRVAMESLRAANLDVSAAKGAFLPALSIETDYGIEANDFALHSIWKAHPEDGYLPAYGYFVTASLTIPVWDWGTMRSKMHQAEYRQEQAKVELTHAQQEMLNNLYSSYNEAAVARQAVEESRHTADLASESLRLVTLRYQGGESPALEVVDAETTLTTARNAYDDAQLRYRVAVATLQTLTGNF